MRDLLAATSAAAFGREAAAVAADREALLERIAELGRAAVAAGTGETKDDPGKGSLAQSTQRQRRPWRRKRDGSARRSAEAAGGRPTDTNAGGPPPPAPTGDQGQPRETDNREAGGEP